MCAVSSGMACVAHVKLAPKHQDGAFIPFRPPAPEDMQEPLTLERPAGSVGLSRLRRGTSAERGRWSDMRPLQLPECVASSPRQGAGRLPAVLGSAEPARIACTFQAC